MLYDIIIGLIMIVGGTIPLVDRKDRNQKGLANAMYKYGGVGLICYGIVYIIYSLFN